MKTMLAVQHADGSREAVCMKCDTPFVWMDTRNGEEYGCPNCGMQATAPQVKYEKLEDELLYRWPSNWPVFDEQTNCPECGSVGRCIVNETLIDVRVRIMSCTRCDSFWRVES